jgi:CRISPR-associated endonuclease/helicase Cas3
MTPPRFAAFFQAMHDQTPFPWQERLADEVVARGWPKLLDLPTGSGKTSALDVALYALAVAPDRMPRRILLVVDRRIVVDQGAELARKLRRGFTQSKDAAAVDIARRLRALWQGAEHEPPFAVAVMRGGMPRDNDWAKRPDQPVVGVSTIDQVGSRLLFRGYGISPRSASLHAGLLGNDTLILLDEVHLATAFAETLQSIGRHHRKAEVKLPERFRAVPMSATPGAKDAQAFSLDARDRAHPVLKQRLEASKPAKLEAIDVRGDNEAGKREVVAERAVKEALRLQNEGAKVIGLVVNRVDTARLAWGLLEKHAAATDRLLVTGRMRPIDRDHLVRAQLLDRAGAARKRDDQEQALVVVATQCIEAGADLDFDGLVTECASLDALRQRFGRLDRRGEVTRQRGKAAAVILGRADLVAGREDDPIYGKALAATWKWMQGAAGKAGVVDFGIDAMASLLPGGEELSSLLAPVSHAPVLLPAHLDSWAQTSPLLRPSPEPDPALWLHGPQRASSEVQVVWRADLVDEQGELRVIDDALIEQLAMVRPSSLEAMSLPIHVVRAWLSEQADARGMADVLAEEEPKEKESGRRRAREPRISKRFLLPAREEPLRWRSLEVDDEQRGGDEEEGAREELRPGDLVVVPSSYGGINRDGTFDPADPRPVTDLGDLAQLRGRGQPSLRITPATLACWALPEAVVKALPLAVEGEQRQERTKRIKEWATSWPPEAPKTPDGFVGTEVEWQVMRDALTKLRRRPQEISGDHLIIVEPRDVGLLQRDELADDLGDALSEDDDSSFRAAAVTLKDHSDDVRAWARRFAAQLGFSEALVNDLALAGWLHDVGKADPRFQRWLVGGDEVRASLQAAPLAKSALEPGNAIQRDLARRRAGYPRGYRHELLSLAMIEQSEGALARAHDRELVLHLVASHHGWCRPFAPALDDPDELTVALEHEGVGLTASTRHKKARLDSGVAQRFWMLVGKYGWWGLAWLEAVMRLADHRASEQRTVEADARKKVES